MVGQRHTGGGCLGIVDQHINAAEGSNRLLHNRRSRGSIVSASGNIRLHGQHLDAVQTLQLLLGIHELLHITAGDNDVGALLGIGGGNAIANGTRLAVFQYGATTTCDQNCFTC